ncbi:hypothetical protein TorRG33x02_162930, partial [Trema orientale]
MAPYRYRDRGPYTGPQIANSREHFALSCSTNILSNSSHASMLQYTIFFGQR